MQNKPTFKQYDSYNTVTDKNITDGMIGLILYLQHLGYSDGNIEYSVRTKCSSEKNKYEPWRYIVGYYHEKGGRGKFHYIDNIGKKCYETHNVFLQNFYEQLNETNVAPIPKFVYNECVNIF